MEKNNKNMSAIYDDSVSSGALLKDIKKKLNKKTNVEIDTISVEQKADKVIKSLDNGRQSQEEKTVKKTNKVNKPVKSNEQKRMNNRNVGKEVKNIAGNS